MKMKKRKVSCLILIILLFIGCLSGYGCGKKEETVQKTNPFVLDQEVVSVKLDETLQLRVLFEGEYYNGPVSWSSADTLVASVKQGYVKGLSLGETKVKAKITYEKHTYEVFCKVTVTSNVNADIYDITAFSGLGDVDVSLSNGLYTEGADVSVISVKDSNGAELDGLQQMGTQFYLTNSKENPLAPGYYSVTYQISLGDVAKEYVRNLRIKSADTYEDLFLLDAVDGTEKMYGMAANLEYLPGLHRDDENPGEYVVYTANGNTGYSKENGISQTLAQFTASLDDAGYSGYQKKGSKAANTVYRMYCRKDNTSSQPMPFFYLNLQDTTNPAWSYLNEDHFAETPNLEVWYRVWYRSDSTQSYSILTQSGGWFYLFNSLNAGENEVGGAGLNFQKGGWIKSTVNLFNIKDKLQGTNSLAIGVGINNTNKGEYIFELYSVELKAPSQAEQAEDGSVNVMLPGAYTGLFDAYQYVIKNADGVVVKTGNNEKTKLSLEAGTYEITYTLSKNKSVLKNKFTRKLVIAN